MMIVEYIESSCGSVLPNQYAMYGSSQLATLFHYSNSLTLLYISHGLQA